MHARKFAGAGAVLAACGWLTMTAPSIAPAAQAPRAEPAAAASAQPAEWLVPEASLRFAVELASRPSPAESGYVVAIPDGGVLPGKFPTPAVFAAPAGTGSAAQPVELESCLLWHNKAGDATVVFADPGPDVRRVHVYLTGAASPRLWTPASRLKPSALLCTEPAPKADLRTARDLARLGAVGPTVHVVNKSGIPIAPLSVGGDESGRPRPAAFYLLSHVITTDPGKTWIAPFTLDGETLVLVNGQELKPQKRVDKWGGTGAWFPLEKGLNRIEVFQTAPGAGEYGSDRRSGGLMYLTWRTPHATLEELGGARSNKVPMPGTSRMETRVLNFSEIARSGDARVAQVEARGGAPVACLRIRPTQVFWVADESPLVVCQVEALAGGNPPATSYSWDFAGRGTVAGPTASWVFAGLREYPVKLTATSAKGTSQCVRPFYAFSTIVTDLSSQAARDEFRHALTTMVNARPAGADPVRDWDASYWNNIIRTLELGKGFELLQNLVEQRRNLLRQTLPPAQLNALEDVYLDMLQQRDPKQALALVDALGRESSGPRLEELFIRKFEIQMHSLDARAEAEAGLRRLAENASGEIKDWATIRLGDLAFLAGNLNQAITCYTEVQNRYRASRNRAEATPLDKLLTEELLPESSRSATPPEGEGPGKAGKRKAREQTAPEQPQVAAKPEPGATPAAPEPGPAAGRWGVEALLDVNLSENVSTLVRNGYFLEAQEALRSWERRFPMSKISGDYVLQEARFRLALGDTRRARAMLEAYCRSVDASSFLPDAARLLVECARQTNTPAGDIRKVIEAVKGNLQFHPVAKELEAFLEGAKER